MSYCRCNVHGVVHLSLKKKLIKKPVVLESDDAAKETYFFNMGDDTVDVYLENGLFDGNFTTVSILPQQGISAKRLVNAQGKTTEGFGNVMVTYQGQTVGQSNFKKNQYYGTIVVSNRKEIHFYCNGKNFISQDGNIGYSVQTFENLRPHIEKPVSEGDYSGQTVVSCDY